MSGLKDELNTNKSDKPSTIIIDGNLHRSLKMKCAELGEPMRARVEGLIKDWLNGSAVTQQ